MKFLLCLSISLLVVTHFAGCLVSPVERSGGPGSVTVENSNPLAIFNAARDVFARNGFRQGVTNFPTTITFDRAAGRTGELVFGSHMQSTGFRIQIQVLPLHGSHDFRVVPRVLRVSSAGRPGFERESDMMRSWGLQLRPLMREIRAQSENVGP